MPHDTINKLEIYTFGSAANHFNNPIKHRNQEAASSSHRIPKAVRHIEHYTNDGEFVARWGALHFAQIENRYMGRIFVRPGTGHLLNQHYLNSMFPLDKDMRVIEHNEFMDMDVTFTLDDLEEVQNRYRDTLPNSNRVNGAVFEDGHEGIASLEGSWSGGLLQGSGVQKPTVKEFSRLWRYRNGRSPDESSVGSLLV